MQWSPGQKVGPYEIIGRLGAGGMGEVFEARDTRLDRSVAIKVLSASLGEDPHFRERFEREARTISALDHPHICALYDIGEHEGVSYLVMQFLDGETLAERLESGPLPVAEALSIATEIASALDAAHRSGIVHRDLKPGNIMLTAMGSRLLDFGLAKVGVTGPVSGAAPTAFVTSPAAPLTSEGALVGTFQYMAPEQLDGEAADARTDIHAFGVVLFEMLTGRQAFSGKTQASLIGSILKDVPPPTSSLTSGVPPLLERVVARCLEKDPNDRWQTARDMQSELLWISGEGRDTTSQVSDPVTQATNRTSARVGLTWILLPIATAVLAALFTWLASHSPESSGPTVTFSFPGTTDAPARRTTGSGIALSPRYLPLEVKPAP